MNVDCFVASETWFSDVHTDNFLSIRGYQLFRDDRAGRVGGGVAIWAKDSLSPQRMSIKNKPSCIEVVVLHLFGNIYLAGLYFPPTVAVSLKQTLTDFLTEMLDELLCSSHDASVILCGDLNRFSVTDVCNNFNLTSTFTGATYGSSQLDYILMSECISSLYSVTSELPFDNSKVAHSSLLASPTSHTCTKDIVVWRTVYDLRKSNVNAFVNSLSSVDWSPVYCSNDVHFMCDFIHNAITEVFKKCIPSSEISYTSKDKPWMTPVLKTMINARWKAFRERNFDKYYHYKVKVKTEIIRAKRKWIMKERNKNMWSVVGSITGKDRSSSLSFLLRKYHDIKEATNAFNRNFVENFHSSETLTLKDFQARTTSSESEIRRFCAYEVFHLFRKIGSKKTSPDIPTCLYKEAAHLLAEPFTALFNQSLVSETIPMKWKRTAIIPIPKRSKPSLNDLRQISLLPIPFKILEKLVLKSIQTKLLDGYGPHQYGFRPQSSTVCANIALHDYITKTLEEYEVQGVQIIAYDFAKAFDRLKFEIILARLVECGIPTAIIRWMTDYLVNRRQFVRIGLTESDTLPVSSGVPQGSVLGPYLFSSCTGSFDVKSLPCKVIMYADDLTICVPIYDKHCNSHVLAAHNAVCKWSKNIGLPLNDDKCRVLCISRKTNFVPVEIFSIPFVNELKILGVTFDDKCDWNAHINSVIKCASRRLFFVRLLKSHVNEKEICIVFNSVVRSVLEYCAPLFIGLSKGNVNKLEKILSRFHRLLCGDNYKTCKSHQFESLDDRRKKAALKLFQKTLLKSHILHHISPVISPTGRVLLPLTKTKFRLSSFFEQASRIFNRNFIRKGL